MIYLMNFRLSEKIVLICCFLTVYSVIEAQQVITGRITDATDGQPLPGAHIYFANTKTGAVSDALGNYKITTPGVGSYEIVVSHAGYEPFFYKIEEPKSFHRIDAALKIRQLSEVVVSVRNNYSWKDVKLFWILFLGVEPSKSGLEVLNPEKVYFFLSGDTVLSVTCKEPIEIVNHVMGYHIRYELQGFRYDYRTRRSEFSGKAFFEELSPRSDAQKRRWERRRKEVYAVSLTHFVRSLYRDRLHAEGFLLAKRDSKPNQTSSLPLYETEQIDSNQIRVKINSALYLACYAKPITNYMIRNFHRSILDPKAKFPLTVLLPQQIAMFSDGTYSGILEIHTYRGYLIGVSAMMPVEYAIQFESL